MKKIELIFGTYNGLPLGTTDVEFEHAYEHAYKPYLTTLYKYPNVSATIYYSGILLSWLHNHHPEFLMLLNDMVKRKQIELLGGAFYEPILPLIPSSDRSGQIEMLTTYLRKRFGKRPRGFWVPQLVWEPSLPATLKNCGMEYSFLDSSFFDDAGVPTREQYRPVITEDQGKPLRIYPVHGKLTPSHMPERERENPELYLKRIVSGCPPGERVVVTVFDEGEALGLWDDSHEPLYREDGWLPRLFEGLSRIDGPVHTVLPKYVAGRRNRAEKCYFGCTPADSLTAWWFSPDPGRKDANRAIRKRSKRLLPSGSFRQIIRRYPESGSLYAKMMHVYVLVNQIRGDRYRKRAAREELWKGQSGYAFFHAKTDGIKRNSIRKIAYGALIEAEKIARERGIFKPYVGREDFDLDGLEEYLCMSNELNVYVHTIGGSVFELDYLARAWNYLDTMGRYEEPYHGSLVQVAKTDAQARRSFVDRFAPLDYSFDRYNGGAQKGIIDLSEHVYEVCEYRRDHMEVSLTIPVTDHVRLTKTYVLSQQTLSVEYEVANTGDSDSFEMALLSEMNLSFASNHEEFLQIRAYGADGTVTALRESASSEDVVSLEARDLKNAATIEVGFDGSVTLWSYPVISHWFARSGSRMGYQCSTFVAGMPFVLGPGESQVRSFRLSVRD